MSNQRYYYVTGNTSQGFMNYLPTNMKEIEQIIVLKHDSHTLKTAVLQQLLQAFAKWNEPLEILCSPFGDEYLEGVIVRSRSLAVITNTVMTSMVKKFTEIELQQFMPRKHTQLDSLTEQIQIHMEKAYVNLAKALKVHDDLEDIYIREMNFDQANKLSDLFIEKILQDATKRNHHPHIYHRFFGTNTDQGPVNKLPEIIEHIQNRVYIKGRAGTGKSVFLKKVIKACMDYGFDVEQYHCSFDPNSTDMVLVPSLDLCVFDSTAPHELSPDRSDDMIIDLYKETVTPGTDEKYEKEIQEITLAYKALLVEGIKDLKEAKFWQDQREEPYLHVKPIEILVVTESILKSIGPLK